MRAGQLRHRVTIQYRTETQNATGEVTWTWSDLATVWASIEPISGREFFSSQQVQSSVTTRIRVRHRTDVNAKMRVKYTRDPSSSPLKVAYYAIEAVIPVQERHREVHLMCVERDADGWR